MRLPTFRESLSKIAAHDESTVPQAVVACDGRAEIARADDGDAVRMVGAEDSLDAVDEQRDIVPDAALAERAEEGQVPADLRGIHV